MINLGVEHLSYEETDSSEGAAIYHDFEKALVDFENTYKDHWMWKSTGASSKSSDILASSKFRPYYLELKKIFDTYQAKLDACQDDTFQVEYSVSFILTRYSSVNSELENETLVLTFNR